MNIASSLAEAVTSPRKKTHAWFSGARYVSQEFGEAFAMECEALKRVRNDMGLTNVQLMVPFVRTLGQARKVTELLAHHGLRRGTTVSNSS